MNSYYSPKAFGGGALEGSNIVKLVYIDEAGISYGGQDPFVIVAAVIIRPDEHWRPLKRYYHDLAYEAFPDAYAHDRYVFHAKDVWHGSKDFDRKKWTIENRQRVFAQLTQVYKLYYLRVGLGVIDRQMYAEEMLKEFPRATKAAINAHAYVSAFVEAIEQVDIELSKNAPDEVAQLVVEDSPKMQGIINTFHAGYTKLPDDEIVPADEFRTERFVDSITFATKKQSVLLQLADHAAFTMKRLLQNDQMMKPFAKELFPHLLADSNSSKYTTYRYPEGHVPYLRLERDIG